ncbi:MAG: AMIN domain-containing protein, partial [Bryobacteraceae bacterium]
MTRVAIEVSSDFHYKSDRLDNPDRLFFDIEGARPSMVRKGIHVIPVNDALLKDIRVAETQPGVTRIVLDLASHAEYTASQLSEPNRLMIELKLKDRPAPPSTQSVTGGKNLLDSPADLSAPVFDADTDPQSQRVVEPPPARAVAAVNQKPVAAAEPLPQPTIALKTSAPALPSYDSLTSANPNPGPTKKVASAEPLAAKRNADGDRSLTR